MRKLILLVVSFALILSACGGNDPEYDFTTAEGIKAYTEAYFEKDSSVTIKSVTVNENAEQPGEFIEVINLTWNNENDEELSKSASQSTSDMFVTDIQEKAPDLTRIVTNIDVPHLSGHGKIEYSRSGDQFGIDDLFYSF